MNIIHLVSNRVWGGGERYALDLCCECIKRGYNVKVMARKGSIPYQEFSKLGLACGTIGNGSMLDFTSKSHLAKVLNSLSGPTVVHVHNFKDAAIAIKARKIAQNKDNIKVVCTRHLVKAAKKDSYHTHLYNAINHIVFVSQLAYDTFMSTHPQVDTSRMSVVHNSIIAPEPKHIDNDSGPTLLYTGRIVPEKGLETLIQALAMVENNNLRLRVCGTGKAAYVDRLKQIAKQAGVAARIEWQGHVDSVWDEIQRADIGIMPSIAPESFGLTLLEYMSQGVAPITTSSGAQCEIVTDGRDGLVVPPADASALAAAINRLASDTALRQKISSEALKTYQQRFSYKNFTNTITHIYTNLT